MSVPPSQMPAAEGGKELQTAAEAAPAAEAAEAARAAEAAEAAEAEKAAEAAKAAEAEAAAEAGAGAGIEPEGTQPSGATADEPGDQPGTGEDVTMQKDLPAELKRFEDDFAKTRQEWADKWLKQINTYLQRASEQINANLIGTEAERRDWSRSIVRAELDNFRRAIQEEVSGLQQLRADATSNEQGVLRDLKQRVIDKDAEIADLRARDIQLTAELEECRQKLQQCEEDTGEYRESRTVVQEEETPFERQTRQRTGRGPLELREAPSVGPLPPFQFEAPPSQQQPVQMGATAAPSFTQAGPRTPLRLEGPQKQFGIVSGEGAPEAARRWMNLEQFGGLEERARPANLAEILREYAPEQPAPQAAAAPVSSEIVPFRGQEQAEPSVEFLVDINSVDSVMDDLAGRVSDAIPEMPREEAQLLIENAVEQPEIEQQVLALSAAQQSIDDAKMADVENVDILQQLIDQARGEQDHLQQLIEHAPAEPEAEAEAEGFLRQRNPKRQFEEDDPIMQAALDVTETRPEKRYRVVDRGEEQGIWHSVGQALPGTVADPDAGPVVEELSDELNAVENRRDAQAERLVQNILRLQWPESEEQNGAAQEGTYEEQMGMLPKRRKVRGKRLVTEHGGVRSPAVEGEEGSAAGKEEEELPELGKEQGEWLQDVTGLVEKFAAEDDPEAEDRKAAQMEPKLDELNDLLEAYLDSEPTIKQLRSLLAASKKVGTESDDKNVLLKDFSETWKGWEVEDATEVFWQLWTLLLEIEADDTSFEATHKKLSDMLRRRIPTKEI